MATYNLTLTRNNTGQDTFTFYSEWSLNEYLTESVLQINESIELNNPHTNFVITTPNGNDDFDFVSSSLQ